MDTTAPESKEHLPMLFGSEFAATIQVEVCQKRTSAARAEDVKMHVMNLLQRHPVIYRDYTWSKFDNEFLLKHVNSVAVVDTEMHLVDSKAVDLLNSQLQLHVFQLWEDGPATEELEQDNEALSAASHWLLPAAEFQGLWENLVYDNEIKSNLLQYITTTILFSDMNVDSNVISWNRVVLLHGPPGTGKTSLCKALAQKLSIRLSGRYKFGQLIEINSHSLFSKWFSESGKLVMKMFQKIQDLIDDKESLICVLIDEVESLTASRSSSLAGTEPSDAIRVVNTLLTQIDQIKRYPNVIILTTSNLTGKIDMAFVDRADIKQYIGPPSAAAIFKIYLSGLEELMKVNNGIRSRTSGEKGTYRTKFQAVHQMSNFKRRTIKGTPTVPKAINV
uniref:pachytene checkpoint protein 2 homolog isoform X2 n=1 Tax=Myxine glutinosa TaxID=7769 RepID=UPI00358E36FD